jgi:UDP-3-O-[3-hydroxymyristoyl] glucosamine N-acyltransferase
VSATLQDIHAAQGGVLHGDPARVVQRIASLAAAGPDDLSFVSHARYAQHIDSTRAGVLIVAPALLEQARQRGDCIEAADPYLYYARLTQWWKAREVAADAAWGVHATALVDPTAVLEAGISVGPFAVVQAGAHLGAACQIGAHAVVERRARIGAGTRLAPGVVFGHDCAIGARGLLHAGVVIGADGFGFAPHQGEWVKIEQLGAVRIGNDVEIGANSCIDRGALEDTVIEDGVKLDNLIQIGHNVHVGAHTAMAGCVGVAGSARIGAHCTVGGGAVVLGHLTLADHVHISAASVVMRSILQPGQYSGVFPIDDNKSWEKNAATLRQLHRLRERLKALEHRP